MQDARSLPHKSQEHLRVRAVRAVVQKGQKQYQVAELMGVTVQSITAWVKSYRAGGYVALRAKKKGRPLQASKLLPWQCAVIVKIISDKTPDQLKFPFVLWTRDAVGLLIKEKYGFELSRWSVGRLLKRWGFTPQKPAKKSYFQNSKKVQNWLKHEYPFIAARAKAEGAEIQWCDEMGARSDDQVGRTYSKKGRTPEVKVSGIRFRCNMISSLTNLGKLRFMMFKNKFTADVFINFLARLTKSTDRKIFFIADSHPVHKTSKKVQRWLEKHQDKIELFFMPTYSPELNPTEYLNQDVKTNALRKRRAKNQSEMIQNIQSFMRSKQKQPLKVKKYFQAQHVKYAA
jgi:transposase